MAPCIAVTVVSRSDTTVEIETFITVPSSTITNCADPRTAMTPQRFMATPSRERIPSWGASPP